MLQDTNSRDSAFFRFPFLEKWRQGDVLKYMGDDGSQKHCVLFGLTHKSVYFRTLKGTKLQSLRLNDEEGLSTQTMKDHIDNEELPVWNSQKMRGGMIVNLSTKYREELEDEDNLLLNK